MLNTKHERTEIMIQTGAAFGDLGIYTSFFSCQKCTGFEGFFQFIVQFYHASTCFFIPISFVLKNFERWDLFFSGPHLTIP